MESFRWRAVVDYRGAGLKRMGSCNTVGAEDERAEVETIHKSVVAAIAKGLGEHNLPFEAWSIWCASHWRSGDGRYVLVLMNSRLGIHPLGRSYVS